MKHSRRQPHATRPPDETATLTVEELAMGGDGVAHLDGMAVFVPGAVPGDVVEASIQRKGNFARARVLNLLQPSTQRVASDCGLHPACGGCPWLEVRPDAQLLAKHQALLTTLAHVGRLSLDGVDVRAPAGAASQTRYRHRARVHSERQGEGRVVGYLPMRGRGVIPVNACVVLETPLERVLPLFQRVLRRAPPGPLDVQASCEPPEQGGRVGVLLDILGPPDVRLWTRVMHALMEGGIHAVEVQRKGRTVVQSRDLALRHAVAPLVPGGPFEHDASCFTQGNRAQNLTLQKLVLAALAGTGGEHVLELHAGSANFTLPVARTVGRVSAVESHPRAVDWGQRNIRKAGMDHKAVLHVANADHVPSVLKATGGARVDAILLDPPRTGAPGLAGAVGTLKPRRVVYVSCNPATLARDVAAVAQHGYALRSVQAVDLFPRTWHVEAVAVLEPR